MRETQETMAVAVAMDISNELKKVTRRSLEDTMPRSWSMEQLMDVRSEHPIGKSLNKKMEKQYGLTFNNDDWKAIILAFLKNGDCTEEIRSAVYRATSPQPELIERFDNLQKEIERPLEPSRNEDEPRELAKKHSTKNEQPVDFNEKVENLRWMKKEGFLDSYTEAVDQIKIMAAGGDADGIRNRNYKNYKSSHFRDILIELGELAKGSDTK